jgi:pimeloyl-ACP methyl ester carboxylesterase
LALARISVILLFAIVFTREFAIGQSSISKDMETNPPNWRTPTLGGMQFWTDHRWWFGWRIQNNALTGHWRLLDANNVRQAWGTREHCLQVLDNLIRSDQARPPFALGRVVLLMHGLMRTSRSMGAIARALEDADLGTPVSAEYASTRASIAVHSQAFRELVENLPDKPRLTVVGHSMGNIVVRHAIAQWQRSGDPMGVLRRFDGMVMLGPPNQGASIARRLAKTGLFEIITGQGGMELGKSWSAFQEDLAIPPFPFAIVSGRLTGPLSYNPLIDGEGDFVVTVDETQLDGAAATVEFPVLHSFLMDDPQVQRFTVDFLKSPLPKTSPL